MALVVTPVDVASMLVLSVGSFIGTNHILLRWLVTTIHFAILFGRLPLQCSALPLPHSVFPVRMPTSHRSGPLVSIVHLLLCSTTCVVTDRNVGFIPLDIFSRPGSVPPVKIQYSRTGACLSSTYPRPPPILPLLLSR